MNRHTIQYEHSRVRTFIAKHQSGGNHKTRLDQYLGKENMDKGSYQEGAGSMDLHLNLQQQQQALHKLQKHLQQPQQQIDGHAQQSEQQQVQNQQQQHYAPEHTLLQQQQQLQQVQLPVLQQVQNEQLSQQQHRLADQENTHQQVLQQSSDLSLQQGGETEWKQCAKCSLRFPLNLLQIHLVDCLTSVDMKPGGDLKVCSTALFVCSICAKISRDLESLRVHEQSHSVEDRATCRDTDGQCSGMFMCSPCRLTFSSSEELLKHVEMHKSSSDDRVCQVCGAVFLQLANLLQHIDIHHEHVKACPCGAVFPTKQDFRHHQELCMPVLRDPTAATDSAKSYKCRLCPKVFGTVQSRLQHERVHRRSAGDTQTSFSKVLIKKFLVCNLCKQEFSSKENYRAHVRSHTGEKPYGCRHCPKSFSSLQGRWQHEKIHKR